MALFRRRPKLPADRRPALESAERVLAWAEIASGGGAAAGGEVAGGEVAGGGVAGGDGVVVATNRGLWLPGRADRLGWHDIHKAVWSGRELAVTPAGQVAERADYLVVADRPAETYLLLDPGEVPSEVRSRVTRSVAYTSHHPLPAGGVRVVARRVSGVDGLTWTVRYDPGTPSADEAVIEATDRLVAAARSGIDQDSPG